MSKIILPHEFNGKEAVMSHYINGAKKTKYEKGNFNALLKLCTDCATILQSEYPCNGELAWGCKPTPDGSMINIRLFGDGLYGKHGWPIPTSVLQQETGRRELLIRAGGEYLERCLGSISQNPLENKRPRDTRGEVIPEL